MSVKKCPKITRLPRLCKIDVKDLLPIRDPNGTNSYITVGQLIDLVNTYFNLGSCVPSTLLSSNILLGSSSLFSKEFQYLLDSVFYFKASLVSSGYFENATQAQVKFTVNLLKHFTYQSFITSVVSFETFNIESAEYELALIADILVKSAFITSAQYQNALSNKIAFGSTVLHIIEALGITSNFVNIASNTVTTTNYESAEATNLTVVASLVKPITYQEVLTNLFTIEAETLKEVLVTYLTAKQSVFYIICPTPRKLDTLTSDGSFFTWRQVKGTRSVNITPADSINPIVDILGACSGSGCDSKSFDPVVLQVEPANRPDLMQEIVIYTVPTSNQAGKSHTMSNGGPDTNPNRAIPSISVRPGAPKPQLQSRAFIANPQGTYAATWDIPTSEHEHLVKTIWQHNLTGHYEDVQSFGVSTHRFFIAQKNVHYRVLSVFNTLSYTSNLDSERYYFENETNTVVADETLTLGFGTDEPTLVTLPLDAKRRVVEEALTGSYAFTSMSQGDETLPLNSVRFNLNKDSVESFAAFTAMDSGSSTSNLGGILIR